MLMSVMEFLGSGMLLQFSLPKGGEGAGFGFGVLEFCCPFLSTLSCSASELGMMGLDSAFCFLGFCS